jgi:hypothetical protein
MGHPAAQDHDDEHRCDAGDGYCDSGQRSDHEALGLARTSIDEAEVMEDDEIGLLIALHDRERADQDASSVIDDGGETFGFRPSDLVAGECRRHQLGWIDQPAGFVAQADGQKPVVEATFSKMADRRDLLYLRSPGPRSFEWPCRRGVTGPPHRCATTVRSGASRTGRSLAQAWRPQRIRVRHTLWAWLFDEAFGHSSSRSAGSQIAPRISDVVPTSDSVMGSVVQDETSP